MLVKIYATKPDGYYWKAPSWSDGRGFAMTVGTDVELEGSDLDALAEHVKAGYWLRYEPVEAPKPAETSKLITDKAEKKK